jgi:DNA-binding CsgD family transcriptional regulator
MTTEQVAKALFISPDTVRVHLRNSMETLEAGTRTHAVAKALRQSLIS